jgi:hypothetical protein
LNGPPVLLYHTMINTTIGDQAVVQAILDFMKTRMRESRPERAGASGINIR